MKNSIILFLLIQIAMIIILIFDIAILRIVIGFIYLSILPGILILRILKLKLDNILNYFSFSIGLSISFLMFIGLLMNEFYPIIVDSKPLSTLPMFVALTISLLALFIIGISKRKGEFTNSITLPTLNQIYRVILLIGLPLSAIIGALLKNSNILLMTVTIIIILTAITIFSKRLVPSELYSLVIFVIALSLLFHGELISKYLMGWDVFGEFYLFRLVKSNSLWNSAIPFYHYDLSNYNSILSITILPTIYSNLLGIRGEWIFKVIYPIFFSLVPVILYQTYKNRFGISIAFLSAFYFSIFPRFYIEEKRVMIGLLFFALLIFLILNLEIAEKKGKILLIIFSFSLIISQYSLSFIFLYFIALTLIFKNLGKKLISGWYSRKKSNISGSYFLLLLVMIFGWYTYVTISPLISLWEVINRIFNFFIIDFLNPGARGEIYGALNPIKFSNLSFIHQIDFIFSKFPYLFLIIGIIYLIKNRKTKKFDLEYASTAAAAAFLILMCFLLPHFSPAYVAHRFYHISLIFLAPISILGGYEIFKKILTPLKNKARIKSTSLRLVSIIFIILLLFKVGYIYEVTGDIRDWGSNYMSFNRMKTNDNFEIRGRLYESFASEQEVFSAMWLSEMVGNNRPIYSDHTASYHVLRGYGMIIVEWDYVLSNNTKIEKGAYIYMRQLNVEGILRERGMEMRFTNFSIPVDDMNKIYSNGYSEIYSSPFNNT